MNKIISKSEEETREIAKNLAKKIEPGAVIALIGDLGAGKTTFAQAFAKALGVTKNVNSPTFNIIKVYKVSNKKKLKQFCHIDAYRIHLADELLALGVNEYLDDPKTIVLIEWADKVMGVLPKNIVKIEIKHQSDSVRLLSIDKK